MRAKKIPQGPMKWKSWGHLMFTLSHSLCDVVIHGHVLKGSMPIYEKAVEWANDFDRDFDGTRFNFEKATFPTWDFVKDNLLEMRPIVIHQRTMIDCLSQDIFTALFAIDNICGFFSLEEEDLTVLLPVQKHLQKLVPWFKIKQ